MSLLVARIGDGLAACPIWIAGPGACLEADDLLAGDKLPGVRVTAIRGA